MKMSNDSDKEKKSRTGRFARFVLRWATGVAPTKLAIGEFGKTASLIRDAFYYPLPKRNNLVQRIKQFYAEAKADRALARQSPEALWDISVAESNITESSIRNRYRRAYWMGVALLFALSANIALLVSSWNLISVAAGYGLTMTVILVVYLDTVHKLYVARYQRIPSYIAFIMLGLQKPMLFVPDVLPGNYKLRAPSTSSVTKDERHE
ncbi:hypothetical protein ACM7JK_07630 [Pseudomonas aeruginosa]